MARLLALVETQRRYYQEIVASVPVGLLVLSSDLTSCSPMAWRGRSLACSRRVSRRMDTILPASLLDRIEEVLKTSVPQTGVMVETGRDKRRLRVGILAIRNWDEEAAQEALLAMEDLTGLAVFAAPAPSSRRGCAAGSCRSQRSHRGRATGARSGRNRSRVRHRRVPAISAQQFVDNIDAIMWAVELPSMNFVFANPQAEKLLGFAPGHWTSHPSFWLDRVHNADRDWVAQSYQRAIESGMPHSCEFRAITASGGAMWLREYSRLLPAAGEEGQPRYMIGVAVDVRERRMLENQLVQAERVDAVSRLASRMAHDLNNTLMILTGYSEELLTGLPAGSTMRSDVQEILTATERVGGLTSQLLSFARRQGQVAGSGTRTHGRKNQPAAQRPVGNTCRPGLATFSGTKLGSRGPRAVGTRLDRHCRARAARHARRRTNHDPDLAPGDHRGTADVRMLRFSRETTQ